MSDQAPATQPPKPNEPMTLVSLVSRDSTKQHFERMLGRRAGQYLASIVNSCSSGQLATANPRTVVAAAAVAAALDLPIDKNLGFAFIIPYKGLAQFQLGYKGIIQLALRSGQYRRMNAAPVNAEAFKGYDSVGEPIIDWSKLDQTAEPVGYAAAWELVNGFTKTIYWTKGQVEAHAGRYSQAFRAEKKDSPWFTSFDKMAMKTVLKNGLSMWGILSVDMQRAIEHDQGIQKDIDAPVEYIDADAVAPESKDTMGGVLGDSKKTEDPAKTDKEPPSSPVVDPTEYKKVLSHVENYALNFGLSEAKVIDIATKFGWEATPNGKLNTVPYATLVKLRDHFAAR